MFIWEKAVEILNDTQDKNYIYVSNNVENLGRVEDTVKSKCDVMNATSRVVLTFPRSMGFFYAQLDGVYYDSDATNEGDIKAYLFLHPHATFIKVNPSTQEILTTEE